MGDTWHLDEVFVKIQGRQQYLWRAVDEDGDVIDILTGLTGLETLNLSETQVTDAGISELQKALPNCRISS